MNETRYRRDLIRRIKHIFPGCVVLKNDASYVQGVPDIIVLYKDMWAMLEVKISGSASHQPNQDYYVNLLGEMSFASFIHPGNEEDVLLDLQHTFRSIREARIS